jgi:hypothetical protein
MIWCIIIKLLFLIKLNKSKMSDFKISSCGSNKENAELCIKHNVDGHKNGGYKTGDTVFLIFKEGNNWYLRAKGVYGEKTENKPWSDQDYTHAFDVKWEAISATDITPYLKDLAQTKEAKELSISNYGLLIQGNKNLNTSFGEVSLALKKYLNTFFKRPIKSITYYSDNTFEEILL